MSRQIQVTDELHAKLKRLAKEQYRTIGAVMEWIIDKENLLDIQTPTKLTIDEVKASITAVTTKPTNGEKSCCSLSKPCQHWQWDSESVTWVNLLSGRMREE